MPSRWPSTCWLRPSTDPGTLVIGDLDVRRAARRAGRAARGGAGHGRGGAAVRGARAHDQALRAGRRRSRRSTSSSSGPEAEALGAGDHAGRLRVRGRRRRHGVRRLHRRLEPRAADRRRRPLRLGAVPAHFRRSFTEVRIADAAAAGPGGGAGGARRGLRAARPVDGGAHSRQWTAMSRSAEIDRKTGETEVRVTPRARRHRRRRARDRRRVPRPHARPGRPPRAPRPRRAAPAATCRPARTTRSRTWGSASARRSTRRSATGPGSRATARRPCPWTKSRASCAIDISGRGLCVFEADAPAGRDRQLRPRAGRGVLPRAGHERQADAAHDGRDAAPTPIT